MSIKPFLPRRSLLSPKWSQHLFFFVGGLFFLGLAFLSIQQLTSIAQHQLSNAAARPPVVDDINPNSGLITGGYQITITGSNFDSNSPVDNFDLGNDFTCTYYSNVNRPMYCWGNNSVGQLGNNGQASLSPEFEVINSEHFSYSHGAGKQHHCTYSHDDQKAYCWGLNSAGQLGDGTNTNRLVPTPVKNIGAGSSIAIDYGNVVNGGNHSCALTSDKQIYCWGDNSAGQLGNGNTINSNVPVLVNSSLEFVSLTAGLSHTCAMATDNKLYCWGDNTYGQLGTGNNVNSNVPVAVNTILSFYGSNIDTGDNHNCLFASDDKFYCWGDNTYGQLGTGNNVNSNVPVAVNTILSLQSFKFSVGGNHNCAFDDNNKLYCWGDNTYGQLGTGNNVNSNVPVAVNTTKQLSNVEVGGRHTCALEKHEVGNNYVLCWGDNTYGQLGTGNTNSSNTPVVVADLGDLFTNSKVLIDNKKCTGLSGDSSTITCIVPAGDRLGPVDVNVFANSYSVQVDDGFTYLPLGTPLAPTIDNITPNQGPLAGGTVITITGSDLKSATGSTTVTIDGNPCTNVSVNATGTSLTCTTPPGASPGAKTVVLTHIGGSANGSYTYLPPQCPQVTNITPNQGPLAGGTVITITGSDLKPATGSTTVTIDGNPCTNVSVNATGTSLTCTTPAGSAGSANVVVSHDGCPHNTTPDGFNYTDGSLSLNIAGGSNQWFNTARVANLRAQATIYPLLVLRHRLDQPAHTVVDPNSTPPKYLCNQGTSVTIDPANQYDFTHQLNDLPGSQGKHTLYACTQQADTNHVLIASANFNYDSLPLQCSFAPAVADPLATHSAIFSLTCHDQGVVGTTASGPCPTVAPADPNDACPNNYLNQYICATNETAGSTCSLTVSDYAGNLATFTSSGNPFGTCPPHQIINPVTHACENCPPNTIPNNSQTACISAPTPTPTPVPTPTPTPTPTSTPTPKPQSTPTPAPSTPKPASPPVCDKPSPSAPAPLITKAERVGKNSIRLFFEPAGKPVTGYVISYGYKQADDNHQFSFGTKVSGSNPGSVVIGSLNLNATYVFKIMPVNDCASGPWSNVYPVTIKPLGGNPPANKPIIPSSSELKPSATPTPVPTPVSTTAPAITSNLVPPVEEIPAQKTPDYSPFLLLLALLGLLLPSGLGLVLTEGNQAPLEAIKLTLTSEGRRLALRRTNRFGVYDAYRLKSAQYTLSLSRLNTHAGASATPIIERSYQLRAGFLHPFAPIITLPLSAPDTNWRVKLLLYWFYFIRALAYVMPYSLLASIIWVALSPNWLTFSVLITNIIWLLKVIYKASR